MEIKLIGAGAVGMSVAMKLAKVSPFALIVDNERAERYSSGLFYNGERVNLKLETPSLPSKAELIIVAVKNFQLRSAIDTMRPFVSDETIILPLLNGISAEEELGKEFGEDKVLYGFITNLSSVHSGNSTECFSGGGTICFNEKNGGASPRVKEIASIFSLAKQDYIISEDIVHDKWWKFMMNTAFNTITATLNADYAASYSNEPLLKAVRMIAGEVQSVAKAEGVELSSDDINRMLSTITAFRDHGRTSMLQDVTAGRETENQYFSGEVSKRGRRHGIPTPYIDLMMTLLEARRNVKA